MKQIIVTKEVRESLMEVFGVNRTTVWSALNFKRESKLHEKIRKVALEKGGQLVGGHELETSFSVGKMVQTYGGYLRIEHLFDLDQTLVYLDGELKEEYKELSIVEYEKLQQRLMTLVDTRHN